MPPKKKKMPPKKKIYPKKYFLQKNSKFGNFLPKKHVKKPIFP